MKPKLTKKKQAGVMSVILALALLLTGSLAWQDVSQHKTSNFQTATLEHHVVLVQEFEEVTNWSLNDPEVTKTVAVRNGEDNNPVDTIYHDAYVRLQFKQFMEIGKRAYVYSDDRYMIDTDGNFVRGKTQTAVEAQLTALGLDPLEYASDIEQVFAYFDAEQDEDVDIDDTTTYYFYVKTKANDPNGQYGKHLIIEATVESMVSIVDGIDRSTDNEDDHHSGTNKDALYSTKVWYDDHEINALFDEYVVWNHDDSYITLTEWREDHDSKPIQKWIVDDTSEEGWVYWGSPLTHSQTASIPDTMTTNFLESVELIKQPDGIANYQINVSMDAVSQNDLGLWYDDAPTDLLVALGYTVNTTKLNRLVTQANELVTTYGSLLSNLSSFEASLAEAQAVLDTSMSQSEIDAMVESFTIVLEAAMKEVLESLVSEATPYLAHPYLSPSSRSSLESAVSDASSMISSLARSNTSFSSIAGALTEALQEENITYAVDLEGKDVGDTIASFAGYDWVILAIEDGNALIGLSDALKEEDFDAIGFTPNSILGGYGTISFQGDMGPYISYEASRLKQVDEAFYNSILKNTDEDSVVQPVTWEEEVGISEWDTRTDGPTLVSTSGTKTAFSLSVSDINVYGITASNLNVSQYYRLRSPGDSVNSVATVDVSGALMGNSLVHYFLRVRPALWIAVE